MHDNQLEIAPAVVRALIDRQFPQWRSMPVTPVAADGTVNAIFRIGDRYAARFPLEAGVPGTCSRRGRDGRSGRRLARVTWSGRGERRGRFSSQWAWSGTTPRATRSWPPSDGAPWTA